MGQVERPHSSETDVQLESGRPLHRQMGRPGARQHLQGTAGRITALTA
jgi:hypothetical protein